MKGWYTKNHMMIENSRKSFEGHTRADENQVIARKTLRRRETECIDTVAQQCKITVEN